ncbi:MAG: hypothetical protein WC889_14855, partial [Myxococcota bacterium]
EQLRLTALAYTASTKRAVQSVFVCGGCSLIPGFASLLGEEMGMRCENVADNLRQGVDPQAAGRFALAAALGIESVAGLRREIVSFRIGEFGFKGEFKFIRGKLVQLGVAIAVVISLAIANVAMQLHSSSAYEKKLDDRLGEVTKNILGKPYDDYTIALSIMKQKLSPQASPIPKITAMDNFMDISTRFPPELMVDLREVSIQTGKIKVEGDTESFEAVDKIVNGLRTNKCFTDINKGRVRKSIDGQKVEFDLTITPKC